MKHNQKQMQIRPLQNWVVLPKKKQKQNNQEYNKKNPNKKLQGKFQITKNFGINCSTTEIGPE